MFIKCNQETIDQEEGEASSIASISNRPALIITLNDTSEGMNCQECYKNSALFTQFLYSFSTYVWLSYFVCLHCTNLHTPLPFLFFSIFMTFRTSRQVNQIYLVLFFAKDTSRTITLQIQVIIILWTWISTLFPQLRSLCSVWGLNSVQTS